MSDGSLFLRLKCLFANCRLERQKDGTLSDSEKKLTWASLD